MDGQAGEALRWITEAKRMEIPFFQRPYVWNENDFEALIESFQDAPGNTMPFFGSVIMKKMGTDEERNFLIIDGQQRITTFNVLVRTLLDLGIKFADTLSSFLKNTIYDIEIDNDGNEIFLTRLIPSNIDKDAFEKIMDAEADRPLGLDALSNTPIENAYAYFYKYFSNAGADVAKKFALKLYNHNKSMIFITLDDKDDEQKIFDSVNSLGKALSNSDIIKNYIFQKMKEYANGDSVKIDKITKIYDKYWDSIFYAEKRKDFWYQEFTLGRVKTDHLECFLKDFAIICKFYAAKKTTGLHGLCNAYKSYIDELDYDSVHMFVKEMYEYAKVYYAYKTEYQSQNNFIWSDYKNRLLLILDYLETSTFNPYILKLLKENADDLEQKMYNFERFLLQRFIYDGTTKNYNQCCEGLINALNDQLYFEQYIKGSPASNITYKDKFRRLTNKQGLLLMFLIEMLNRNGNEGMYADALNINAYTLEHVMPQKWHSNGEWMQLDSYDDAGNMIDKNNTQHFLENRNSAVKSLGNFALLTAKLNASVSNGSFSVKINGNGKKNGSGMRAFAANLSTTQRIITIYDVTKKWDERNIYFNEKAYFEKLNAFYHFE